MTTALSRRHRIASELARLYPDRPPGRKTSSTRAPRRDPAEMPDWVLTFTLPGDIAFAVSIDDPSGVSGVTIKPGHIVEVRGKAWEWVYRQAATYLAIVSKGRDRKVTATVRRGPIEHPADSAPPSGAPVQGTQDIILVTRPSVVFPRAHRDPLIVPVKP